MLFVFPVSSLIKLEIREPKEIIKFLLLIFHFVQNRKFSVGQIKLYMYFFPVMVESLEVNH